jgi:hypothetical protein
MRLTVPVVALLMASLLGGTSAEASRTQQSAHTAWFMEAMQGPTEASRGSRRGTRSERASESRSERGAGGGSIGGNGVGPRPSQWCGWWMRTQRGGGPEFNLAWNWTRYGSPGSPQVGAVVVWRHHVGEIVGQASNGQWIVRSGNDGGQVRSRARSISGAVIRV